MDLRSAQNILYNGNPVAAVICNGVTVWPSIPRATFSISSYAGTYYQVLWYSGDTLLAWTAGTYRSTASIPVGCKVVVKNMPGRHALTTYGLNGFSALSSTGLITSAAISGNNLIKAYSATGIMTGDVAIQWDFNQYGAPFTAEYSASAYNKYNNSSTAALILTAVNYDWFGENKSSYIVTGASNSRNFNSSLTATSYGPWSGKFVQSGDPYWWRNDVRTSDRIYGIVQQSGNLGTVSASASASASSQYATPVAGSSTFTQWVSYSSAYPYQLKDQYVSLRVGLMDTSWNPINVSYSYYTVTATGYL